MTVLLTVKGIGKLGERFQKRLMVLDTVPENAEELLASVARAFAALYQKKREQGQDPLADDSPLVHLAESLLGVNAPDGMTDEQAEDAAKKAFTRGWFRLTVDGRNLTSLSQNLTVHENSEVLLSRRMLFGLFG